MKPCETCKHCSLNALRWWQIGRMLMWDVERRNPECRNIEVNHSGVTMCEIERMARYDKISPCGSTGRLWEPKE